MANGMQYHISRYDASRNNMVRFEYKNTKLQRSRFKKMKPSSTATKICNG